MTNSDNKDFSLESSPPTESIQFVSSSSSSTMDVRAENQKQQSVDRVPDAQRQSSAQSCRSRPPPRRVSWIQDLSQHRHQSRRQWARNGAPRDRVRRAFRRNRRGRARIRPRVRSGSETSRRSGHRRPHQRKDRGRRMTRAFCGCRRTRGPRTMQYSLW